MLIGRKQHRQFPFFFAYAIFSVVADTARQIASGHPVRYFIVYWSAEALYGIVALLVLREVFHRVFEVEYDLYRWVRFLLPLTVVLILAVSVYHGIHRTAGYSHVHLDGTLIRTDRSRAIGPTAGVDLWWSGKHHHHGGNVQVITAPDGWPLCRFSSA